MLLVGLLGLILLLNLAAGTSCSSNIAVLFCQGDGHPVRLGKHVHRNKRAKAELRVPRGQRLDIRGKGEKDGSAVNGEPSAVSFIYNRTATYDQCVEKPCEPCLGV